jgi:hypothetical protein
VQESIVIGESRTQLGIANACPELLKVDLILRFHQVVTELKTTGKIL